jgi:hypothetical protein
VEGVEGGGRARVERRAAVTGCASAAVTGPCGSCVGGGGGGGDVVWDWGGGRGRTCAGWAAGRMRARICSARDARRRVTAARAGQAPPPPSALLRVTRSELSARAGAGRLGSTWAGGGPRPRPKGARRAEASRIRKQADSNPRNRACPKAREFDARRARPHRPLARSPLGEAQQPHPPPPAHLSSCAPLPAPSAPPEEGGVGGREGSGREGRGERERHPSLLLPPAPPCIPV